MVPSPAKLDFSTATAAVAELDRALRAGGKGHVRFDRPGDAILAKILNNGEIRAQLACAEGAADILQVLSPKTARV